MAGLAVVAVAPSLGVDGAAAVVAEGGLVADVVPNVVAAVLEEVGAGVAALSGVDADGGAAGCSARFLASTPCTRTQRRRCGEVPTAPRTRDPASACEQLACGPTPKSS